MKNADLDIVYRIKDEDSGLYYREEYYEDKIWVKGQLERAVQEKNKSNIQHYSKVLKKLEEASFVMDTNYRNKKFVYFDKIGRLYPTKMGAEKICSGFTKCTYKDRATKAGRILKAKYNFVVVKTKINLTDVKEE